MHVTINTLISIIYILLSTSVYGSELGNGSESYQRPRDRINPYSYSKSAQYGSCTNQEKDERTKIHNNCLHNFSSIGLPKAPKLNDLIPPNSCPAVNTSGKFLAGCAKYLVNIPIETAKAVGTLLGVGKYDALVLEKCGAPPQRAFPKKFISSIMPDGQKRYASLSSEDKFISELIVYEKCYSKTVKDHETKIESSAEQYKSSMQQINKYCRSKNIPTKSQIKRTRRPALRERLLTRLKNCQLEAISNLGISCDKCLKEISPEVKSPEGSSMFKELLDSLKEANPYAWKCYTPEKLGELACAAASTALGAGGSALAVAKLIKAVGKKAADQAVAQAAKAAKGAGDSKESRKALAEAVLKRSGLLQKNVNLTDEQAEAIWRAHQLDDSKISEKARILQKAGFDKDERSALIRGLDDLDGSGVTGGFAQTYNPSDYPNASASPNGSFLLRNHVDAFNQSKKAYKRTPSEPSTPRLYAENLRNDTLLKGGKFSDIKDDLISLRRQETLNQERVISSRVSSPTTRNRYDAREAYTEYAAVLPDGQERLDSIKKAAEYLLGSSDPKSSGFQAMLRSEFDTDLNLLNGLTKRIQSNYRQNGIELTPQQLQEVVTNRRREIKTRLEIVRETASEAGLMVERFPIPN